MPKKFAEDDDNSLTSGSETETESNDEWGDDIDDVEEFDSEYDSETEEAENDNKESLNSSSEDESENTDTSDDDSGEDEIEETETENNYKNCVYDFTTDALETLDELPENEKDDKKIISHFQEIKRKDEKKNVKPSDRITKPFLTDKERIRILSLRTDQIAKGAKSFIKGAADLPPNEVAKLELEHKKMPLIIERELPDGSREKWKLEEFINY